MQKPLLLVSVLTAGLILGCSSTKSGNGVPVERGPHGTVAYEVQIQSNEPGVRIEANKEYVGVTPLLLKVYGDRDGTFHNFGTPHYMIQAIPVKAGQNQQTKIFRAGDDFIGDDKIPVRIYFDMAQPEHTVVEGLQVPKK
jgi:hypothetical protein